MLTAVYMVAIGAVCFMVGMIVDSIIVNVKIKGPEEMTDQEPDEQNDYFSTF